MAINTYGITLMKGTTVAEVTTYAQLIPVKDFPDLGGAPDALETTTLSDAAQTFINGIKKSSALEFTANYTEAEFETLAALSGSQKFAVYFGEDGANGKFTFEGELAVWVVGGAVNSVVDMKISIAPSTVIVKAA